MLARLSRGTARLLDVLESTDDPSHLPEDEETFSIDINALTKLLPSPDLPWRRVAGVCGQTISPVCKGIQNMLNEDVENVTRLLYELEPAEEEGEVDVKVDYAAATPAPFQKYSAGDTMSLPIRYHKRRRSSNALDRPLLIPAMHPSVPSILITPCAPSPHSRSSCVPLQDASYGNKLVVPGYPHLNSCFAPLILKPGHAPLVERWQWREGHWWAIVPDSVEVQGRKGWFSRPVSARRRTARPCRAGPPSADCEQS